MTDDGNQIKNKDADLLLIGAIPSSLRTTPKSTCWSRRPKLGENADAPL